MAYTYENILFYASPWKCVNFPLEKSLSERKIFSKGVRKEEAYLLDLALLQVSEGK